MTAPRTLLLLAVLAAPAAACRPGTRDAPPAAPAPPRDPVLLLDTTALEVPDFMARQRVTARYGDRRHTFDAVLQLHGGTLRLLGLTPFGTKAFLLEQRGTQVRFERFVDLELPFAPERILFDVHRALFYSAGGTAADGTVRRALPAFRIEEDRKYGKVVERRFVDAQGTVLAVVRPAPPAAPGEIPPRIVVEAPPYGYRIEIETLSVRRLGATPAPR